MEVRVRLGVAAGLLLATALFATPDGAAQPPESGVAPGTPPTDNRPAEAFADPEVARLQRTAIDVQRELADLAGQIERAEKDLHTATDAANAASTAREQADREVAAQQAAVDEYSATVLKSMAQPTGVRALMSAKDPAEFLDGMGLLSRVSADQDLRLGAAVRRQAAAEHAETVARAAADAAGTNKADLDQRAADAGDRAAAVSSEMRGVVADTDTAVVARQRGQRQRNQATAANWQAYLDRLAAAGITPPPASQLRDPARPPPGLRLEAPGVGATGDLLVLPEETIAAVTMAVGSLGRPYVPGDGLGPAAYSCDGLVRAAYGQLVPPGVADQYAVLAPVDHPHPGDLAFLGPARYGVQGVGLVLDNRTMLTASARLASVVVTDLPGAGTVLGYARPSLAMVAARPVPAAQDGGLPWRCDGVSVPGGVWGGYPNGFIPATALCPVGIGAHSLRCDAAAGLQALSSAFGGAFGRPLCVTDSYRTFASQVRLYGAKPALAAVPGTSNHGWGLAVDLCGGAQRFGSPEYAWLAAHGAQFGWVNPAWARPGAGREEPWHWEFVGP